MRSPAHPRSHGVQTDQFADNLDLYRTVVDLAVPAAYAKVEGGVEGVSLAPVFANPAAVLKNASFSQMARCPAKGTLGPESACNTVKRADIPYMGYSVRVDDWRYTMWLAFDGKRNRGDWAGLPASLHGEELYAHKGDTGADFDAFENENVAASQANAPMVRELRQLLRTRFDTPSLG